MCAVCYPLFTKRVICVMFPQMENLLLIASLVVPRGMFMTTSSDDLLMGSGLARSLPFAEVLWAILKPSKSWQAAILSSSVAKSTLIVCVSPIFLVLIPMISAVLSISSSKNDLLSAWVSPAQSAASTYMVCLFLKKTWLHSSVCSLWVSLWLEFGFSASCPFGFWFGVSTSMFVAWFVLLLLLLLLLLADASDALVLLSVARVCVTETCDAFVLLLLLWRVCVTVAISAAREVSSAVFLAFLTFLVSYGDVCLVFSDFFCCLELPNMM